MQGRVNTFFVKFAKIPENFHPAETPTARDRSNRNSKLLHIAVAAPLYTTKRLPVNNSAKIQNFATRQFGQIPQMYGNARNHGKGIGTYRPHTRHCNTDSEKIKGEGNFWGNYLPGGERPLVITA